MFCLAWDFSAVRIGSSCSLMQCLVSRNMFQKMCKYNKQFNVFKNMEVLARCSRAFDTSSFCACLLDYMASTPLASCHISIVFAQEWWHIDFWLVSSSNYLPPQSRYEVMISQLYRFSTIQFSLSVSCQEQSCQGQSSKIDVYIWSSRIWIVSDFVIWPLDRSGSIW